MTAHIEYLLLSKDCVIVPSLGALLAHSVPAHYDATTGEFAPPRREFSFNGSLTRGDGLLVSSVARRDGLSYEAASRSVDESVADMRRQLAADGVLPLGRLGLLRAGRNGALSFEPFPTAGLYPTREWLQPLMLKEQTVAGADRNGLRRPAAAAARRRPSASYIMVAASLMLVLGIAIAATFRMKYYADGAVQQASLVPDAAAVAEVLASPAPTLVERPGASTAPLLLVLKQHADAAVAVDTTRYVPAASIPAAVGPLFEDGDYFMVVASLASRADAEKFLDESADKSLRILELDGRFRIYAAAAASPARLRSLAAAASLGERYPSAWVCRR